MKRRKDVKKSEDGKYLVRDLILFRSSSVQCFKTTISSNLENSLGNIVLRFTKVLAKPVLKRLCLNLSIITMKCFCLGFIKNTFKKLTLVNYLLHGWFRYNFYTIQRYPSSDWTQPDFFLATWRLGFKWTHFVPLISLCIRGFLFSRGIRRDQWHAMGSCAKCIRSEQ